MRKLALAIVVVTAISLYPISAFSQVAAAFKDSSGNVFVYGLLPNSTVSVGIKGTGTRRVRASSCGVLVVHPSVSFPVQNFLVDGTTFSPSSVSTVQSLPKDCMLTGYPSVFKTPQGALAILGKTPGAVYPIQYPNYSTNKLITVNTCGFVKLRGGNLTSVNVPTITGGRGDYAYSNLPTSEPMRCVRNTMYTPVGWKPPTTVASGGNSSTSGNNGSTSGNTTATTGNTGNSGNSSTGTTGNSGSSTVNSTTSATPTAAKSGNLLIVKNLPPGTYVVANAINPKQSKTYTVVKGCLVSDRTTIGSPSTLLISRQGLTFPVSWASLTEVSAAQASSCT